MIHYDSILSVGSVAATGGQYEHGNSSSGLFRGIVIIWSISSRPHGKSIRRINLAISQRDGFEFNLASLPPDFEYEKKGEFDPGEMKLLYDMGYKSAINVYTWEKYPPLYK